MVVDPNRNIYKLLDFHQGHIFGENGRGGFRLDSFGDMDQLYRVELLVEKAIRGKADLIGDDKAAAKASLRGAHSGFKLASSALPKFLDCLQYSARVELFFDVARDLGLLPSPLEARGMPRGQNGSDQDGGTLVFQWQVYNELLRGISERGKTAKFRAEIRRRWNLADADYKGASIYMDSCLARSPSTRVVQMHLGYWQPCLPEASRDGAPHDLARVKADWGAFAKRIGRPRFDAKVGYLARLAYSRDKGYFVHVAFLLKGKEGSHVTEWCQQFGSVWQDLAPEGLGAFSGVNWGFGLKKTPPSLQRGLLRASSKKDRLAIDHWLLPCFTLSSRCLRPKVDHRGRVFFRGAEPKEASLPATLSASKECVGEAS